MAFVHGKNAAALLDEFDITSYCKAADLSVDIDTADTTTWGKTWKTAISGLGQYVTTIEGLFDPTEAPVFSDFLAAANSGLLMVGPAGLATGDMCRLSRFIETAYKETAPVGDVVGFNFSTMSDTVPGLGRVLAGLAAVTGDANGSTLDGVAQSTTGAIGHIHCTALGGGDTLDVTIEDSSTGSSGWATIGTFAQISAVGAERIVIAGTVKRYTRAVFDITGTTVTVAVAIART